MSKNCFKSRQTLLFQELLAFKAFQNKRVILDSDFENKIRLQLCTTGKFRDGKKNCISRVLPNQKHLALGREKFSRNKHVFIIRNIKNTQNTNLIP